MQYYNCAKSAGKHGGLTIAHPWRETTESRTSLNAHTVCNGRLSYSKDMALCLRLLLDESRTMSLESQAASAAIHLPRSLLAYGAFP